MKKAGVIRSRSISIYDTTLRDGVQGEGISFSEDGKLRFLKLLDDFGVDWAECGCPGSNPADRELFSVLRAVRFSHLQPVAFGFSRRAGTTAGRDAGLKALLEAETEGVAIFGKADERHVKDVLRISKSEHLKMIGESIAFLHRHGRRVFFDAEHFFDGWRTGRDYAEAVLHAAFDNGAERVVLCDTRGGALPGEVVDVLSEVGEIFGGLSRFGIHAHNDSAVAVANSLEAVRCGVDLVEGTINGYGERAGNADLVPIIPALTEKLGLKTTGAIKLKQLRRLSVVVSDLVNLRPDPRAPYVGRNAFCHKAGSHVDAVAKKASSFEHVDPAKVGNVSRIVVSNLSGAAAVERKAQEVGMPGMTAAETASVLHEIKEREKQGYAYEAAEGSFRVLIENMRGTKARPFLLEGFRVIAEKRGANEPCICEATVKVTVEGETRLTVDEGIGPVNALNNALRKALAYFYPEIETLRITDYRVRILDPQKELSSLARVTVESRDGNAQWGTVGVSENIIEASWQALADSIECLLANSTKRKRRKGLGR